MSQRAPHESNWGCPVLAAVFFLRSAWFSRLVFPPGRKNINKSIDVWLTRRGGEGSMLAMLASSSFEWRWLPGGDMRVLPFIPTGAGNWELATWEPGLIAIYVRNKTFGKRLPFVTAVVINLWIKQIRRWARGFINQGAGWEEDPPGDPESIGVNAQIITAAPERKKAGHKWMTWLGKPEFDLTCGIRA